MIVSSDKLFDALGPPVPVEVMRFGFRATLRKIAALGPVRRRDVPPTPEGNLLADFLGPGFVAGIHYMLRAEFAGEVLFLVGRSGSNHSRAELTGNLNRR